MVLPGARGLAAVFAAGFTLRRAGAVCGLPWAWLCNGRPVARRPGCEMALPLSEPGRIAARLEQGWVGADPVSYTHLYLAIGLVLAAGFEGLQEKMELPAPVNKNLFDPTEAAAYGLESLPTSLRDAGEIARASDFVRRELPDEMARRYFDEQWRPVSYTHLGAGSCGCCPQRAGRWAGKCRRTGA